MNSSTSARVYVVLYKKNVVSTSITNSINQSFYHDDNSSVGRFNHYKRHNYLVRYASNDSFYYHNNNRANENRRSSNINKKLNLQKDRKIEKIMKEDASKQIWLEDCEFNRGKVDVVKVSVDGWESGPLSKLVVGHDNSGLGAGWFLQEVRLSYTFENMSFIKIVD